MRTLFQNGDSQQTGVGADTKMANSVPSPVTEPTRGPALADSDNARLAEVLQESALVQEENDALTRKLMKSDSVYASLHFKYWEILQALKQWDMSAGAILSMNRSLKRELRRRREELAMIPGQQQLSIEDEDEYEKLPSFPASWLERAGLGDE